MTRLVVFVRESPRVTDYFCARQIANRNLKAACSSAGVGIHARQFDFLVLSDECLPVAAYILIR
eukprot:scaffold194641_cov39-Prasinocladus_malaysianus.AAC.1